MQIVNVLCGGRVSTSFSIPSGGAPATKFLKLEGSL